MNSVKLKLLTVLLVLAYFTPISHAYDANAIVKITKVETTYMPDSITFQVDRDIGSCTAGTWLTYLPKGNTETKKNINIQASLSAFMTALAANREMHLFISQSGCQVDHLHLL